jgi:hypothetical protein
VDAAGSRAMSDHHRPKPGDRVRLTRGPTTEGVVIATFYEIGSAGMHVRYEHGCSWTSCHDVEMIERAPGGTR